MLENDCSEKIAFGSDKNFEITKKSLIKIFIKNSSLNPVQMTGSRMKIA